jgi:predicted ATPase
VPVRQVSYLIGIELLPHRALNNEYPFNLPAIRSLKLRLTHPVTFFVGENGTGKSTVIEAIAELCGFPASGGGRSESQRVTHSGNSLFDA